MTKSSCSGKKPIISPSVHCFVKLLNAELLCALDHHAEVLHKKSSEQALGQIGEMGHGDSWEAAG